MLEKKKPDLSPDTAMRATTPDLELRIASEPWEIGAYYRIRHQVFVEEQGIFQGTDRDDHDESSIPIIACCEGRIAGAVRCYPKSEGVWYGGRLAVHRDYRKYDIGARLVRKAVWTMERHPEVRRFLANVQIQNVRFFRRLGWIRIGQPFILQGKRHQLMEIALARDSL